MFRLEFEITVFRESKGPLVELTHKCLIANACNVISAPIHFFVGNSIPITSVGASVEFVKFELAFKNFASIPACLCGLKIHAGAVILGNIE